MKNPLLSNIHDLHNKKVHAAFPELASRDGSSALTLHKYLVARPERFFSHNAFHTFYQGLQDIDRTHSQELVEYFEEHIAAIDNAFRNAQEINALGWHDREMKGGDDYQSLILIDQEIHPAYLRLVEAVYQPMLRIVAHFSRVAGGKSTQGLNLYNIVAELPDDRFADVKAPYVHLMRNGIAHGGVRYSSNEIIYRDSKSNELAMKGYDVIRKFDDLLDACNGLLLGYSVFALSRRGDDSLLPQNLLVEEIRVETRTPYWEVTGALPSTIINDQSQLIVYCDVRTMDDDKVRFSTVQTVIQAEGAAPGFDRYFVSMRARNGLPGMASFDGHKLANHRVQSHGIEQYADVVQDYLPLFLASKKGVHFLHRLETFKYAFQVGWPVMVADFRSRTGKPEIVVRNTSIHQNSWGAVLNADVIIEPEGQALDRNIVRNSCRSAIRRARKEAQKQIPWYSLVD